MSSMPELSLVEIDLQSDEEVRKTQEFLAPFYPNILPLDARAAKSGRYVLFRAMLTGSADPVGLTGFFIKSSYLAETVKTVIVPAYRGKGLGAELSRLVEEEVRKRGYRKVMSTILVDNLPMIFIKLKQGYMFEGIHRDHEEFGFHEYSFGKLL